MDVDRIFDRQKEGRYFPDENNVWCRQCGAKLIVLGQDENGNAIYNDVCSACMGTRITRARNAAPIEFKPRQFCNRCASAEPLHGMAWCLDCALKAQELRIAAGEDPAVVALTIATIKKYI